ncbi:helix-turn-helix domain-containing protein [Dokdonia sp.]|uniref:helix-turn-helix domain-containing protein n=1 Tax=Dokdonia sp. TaxID=2024995 RepID=UPI00326625DD
MTGQPQFSLFDLLMLIGITQGVVMSILLFRSKNNKRSSPFLALGILAFSWVNTKPLLHTLHLWDTPFFRYFPNGADVVIAPLLYFYFISLIDGKFRFSRKQIIHFIPFIVLQIYFCIVYFSLIGTSNFDEKDRIANSFYFNLAKDFETYITLTTVVIYLFLFIKRLKTYKEWLNNVTSDSTFPDFKWLRSLMWLSAVIGAFLFFNYGADFFFGLRNSTDLHWSTFSLFASFSVYYLGVIGYKQPNYEVGVQDDISEASFQEKEQAIKTILPTQKSIEIEQAIRYALKEDKVFLNPTLNIQELSRKLSLSQQEVSQVINANFHKKFRDLINEYRVEEVKKKLHSKDMAYMSILGIALDCGFNSEATFYRIFKKNTGLSPKEYRQQSK